MELLETTYYGNKLTLWIFAAVLTLLIGSISGILKQRILRKFKYTNIDDLLPARQILFRVLKHTRWLFIIIMGLFAGAMILTFAPKIERLITQVTVITLLIQIALWINQIILIWLRLQLNKREHTDGTSATTITLLGFILRLILWVLISLSILDNLGFNITTLVASLGIGGIAVALAVQNVLGDIFSSLSIALDKPFVIGDFIIVDDVMGTIEYIGLKTTRIRSLSGEQIIISNSDLLKSRIRNYKRMQERRVVLPFGVLYQTRLDKLEKIPAMVKEIIDAQTKARFDRAHFKSFGDSSLDFEVVYYVMDSDYNVFMDIQQNINLELMRRFSQKGIDFAYPTRTIYLARES